MRRVFDTCHDAIAAAVSGSELPEEFLGALTANESGGRVDASCFEPGVYGHLKAVATGQAADYGSITWQDISAALNRKATAGLAPASEGISAVGSEGLRSISGVEDHALREFATSWGFTQIMGYHMIRRTAGVRSLLDPYLHFKVAVELLNEFAQGYHLLISRDFEPLFRCWNTGRPNGTTFDPAYVRNGLKRMNLYRALLVSPADRRGSSLEQETSGA